MINVEAILVRLLEQSCRAGDVEAVFALVTVLLPQRPAIIEGTGWVIVEGR